MVMVPLLVVSGGHSNDGHLYWRVDGSFPIFLGWPKCFPWSWIVDRSAHFIKGVSKLLDVSLSSNLPLLILGLT